MNWIAVHENVTGSKLRGLRKRLDCSEPTAIGILVILWLWVRKEADIDGIIRNADLQDIEVLFEAKLPEGLVPPRVVAALIREGWIHKTNDGFEVNDWSEWQAQSYAHENRKTKDRDRQREYRAKKKALQKESCHSDSHSDSHGDTTPLPPPKPKKAEEKKKNFAEFVKMKESEHQKLVSEYGEAFTKKCIEVLDNYKGSSGKKYKDDYRAILTWVVNKVKTENPGLVAKTTNEQISGNPFRK